LRPAETGKSTTNRASLLNKTHKILKRTYKHTPTKGDQPLLESLLFAACLENSRFDATVQAFETLKNSFFDWNEIRVSTVKELAEVLSGLAEPTEAAIRVKGILQSVFESDYSFDLEHLKKQNIGAAVKRLQKLQGATPFVVAYATQVALGGHSIPIDKGTLNALYVIGVISESEAEAGNVPGMERAIPKSKGQEFGALLHELGAEFFASPFSQHVRDVLLSIAPDAKERFPKRASKKAPEPAAPEPPQAPAESQKKEAKRDPRKEAAADKKAKPVAKQAEKAARGAKPAPPAKKKPAAPKKSAVKTIAKRKPR
jgi:endonuclease III